MIARWKERTVGPVARRLSLFKNMSTRLLAPSLSPLVSQASRALDRPPLLPTRGHWQRVNQLESEPRSFCSLRVLRPSSLVPPLPCSSLAPLLGSSSSASSSPFPSLVFPSSSRPWEKRLQTVNFRFPGRRHRHCATASNRLSSERAPDPQVVSTVRKRRGRRARKWRRWIVDWIAMARGRGCRVEGGVVHLSIFAYIKRNREERREDG